MAQIPLSGIREIFESAQKIPGVVRLEFGEPDFDTPSHIKEAAKNAFDSGQTKYTSSFGIPTLRDAIAEKMVKENKVKCTRENIVVTNGATSALLLSMLATLNQSDEVLIPDPGWSNYAPIARIAGAVPVGYPLIEKDSFKPKLEALEKLVSPKTRMILVNSPSNPAGSVIEGDQLKSIGELASKLDLLVLTDEVYEKFVYDDTEHVSLASFPAFRERVITVNSFSKTYAMTGWRVGYVVATDEVADAIGKLNGSSNSCVASVSQFAALAALQSSQRCVANMIEAFSRRRKIMLEGLSKLDKLSCSTPKGAFYVFVNIAKAGYNCVELSKRLLFEKHVATVPGSAFGIYGEGYIRLAYANSEKNIEIALQRLREMLSN